MIAVLCSWVLNPVFTSVLLNLEFCFIVRRYVDVLCVIAESHQQCGVEPSLVDKMAPKVRANQKESGGRGGNVGNALYAYLLCLVAMGAAPSAFCLLFTNSAFHLTARPRCLLLYP